MNINLIFSKSWFPYLIIFFISLCSLMILISNPGVFSHDELQKLDHIYSFGLNDYFKQYVAIKVGNEFGTPIRPVAFFIQGILALFIEKYPFVVHFFGVISHTLVAMILYKLIIQFHGTKKLALLTAIIFIISPTSILATGWSAALMDRLYILFGLLSLLFFDKYVRSEPKKYYLFLILIFSSLSILSKETAIVLPCLALVILIKDFSKIRNRQFWIGILFWSLPIISFFIYRLPALINSFNNPIVGAYKASFSNIYDGLYIYFAYPFLITLSEAGNWVFLDNNWILFAIVIHLTLLVALYLNFGFKYVIYYLILYFIFLSPILLIQIKAAHYLYGSGLVFSILIAYLILNDSKYKMIYKSFASVIFVMILTHSYLLQIFIYKIGSCMNTAMITSESAYKTFNTPSKVNFEGDIDAPVHILHRIYTGRNRIGEYYPIEFTVSDNNNKIDSNILTLTMNKECIVYKK